MTFYVRMIKGQIDWDILFSKNTFLGKEGESRWYRSSGWLNMSVRHPHYRICSFFVTSSLVLLLQMVTSSFLSVTTYTDIDENYFFIGAWNHKTHKVIILVYFCPFFSFSSVWT